MNKSAIISKIKSELSMFSPVAHVAATGSVYITFSGSKVKMVRISDHSGHKLKRNEWEVRSDAMTHRGKNNNRVYNYKALSQMIKDFK